MSLQQVSVWKWKWKCQIFNDVFSYQADSYITAYCLIYLENKPYWTDVSAILDDIANDISEIKREMLRTNEHLNSVITLSHAVDYTKKTMVGTLVKQ